MIIGKPSYIALTLTHGSIKNYKRPMYHPRFFGFESLVFVCLFLFCKLAMEIAISHEDEKYMHVTPRKSICRSKFNVG